MDPPNLTEDFTRFFNFFFHENFLTDNPVENMASSCPLWIYLLIGFYGFSIYKNYINLIFSYWKSAKNQITFFETTDRHCFCPQTNLVFIPSSLKSDHQSDYLLTFFIYLYFVSFFLWNCKKNILQLLLVSKLGQSSRPITSQIRPRHFQDSFIHSDTLRITPYTKIVGEKSQTKMTS